MATQDTKSPICCATYTVGEREVKASLYTIPTGLEEQYCIILEQQGERVACEFQGEARRVRALFCDVVFGGVTPCTLCDVIEDRLRETACGS